MRRALGHSLLIFSTITLLGGMAACKRQSKAPQGTPVEAKVADLPAQVESTGTVTPRVGAQVKVGPRISGRLEKLNVRVGDRVEKGQVLAVLEKRDLLASVTRSEASVKEAEAALAYAKLNLGRQEQLVRDGIVSSDAVDVARKSRESAEAQVKNTRSALELSKIQLSYATISAPISGTVASVSTQEGETVAASLSAPTFVTLVDLDRLEVDAFVDEVDIGRVKEGQKATFTVDTYPDLVFAGEVEAIYPQAQVQDNVVYYPVIIRIDGVQDGPIPAHGGRGGDGGPPGGGRGERGEGRRRPSEKPEEGERPAPPPPQLRSASGLLRPQMTASVSIALDTLRGAVVIPSRSVRRENGQAFVMVLEGASPVRRQVSLGRDSGELVQVKSGVSAGEKVLVASTGQRSEGMP